MSPYANSVGALQAWLFEQAVQPVLYAFGAMGFAEKFFDATEWLILGAIEILVLYVLLRPLEAWRPAERWTDRQGVGADVIYTLLGRLGILPMVTFLLLSPVFDAIEGSLRLAGFEPFLLENLAPAIAASPLLSFALYFVILDMAEYWRHRLQHRFDWWWALHALHHSQRKMSFWTDSRNHLVDDVLAGAWLASIALIIGIPPGQFFLIIVASRMVESLSHANLRMSFGAVGERLVVSPLFHRVHHAIGVGHEGTHQGCNFAVLLPIWDVLFRTANFTPHIEPTGVRDQLSERDYGQGFWAQQGLGLARLASALMGRNR
ncbi:MAG: sterol desaturase family protein [Betaproteobacteria bacterium]|nr:sterol desaturase family protein [Betaproteobacteria bacterium]